ncbi:MAG: hypothetical protein IPK83_09985 [Planctomycetes bacterium]|nr:hypothetical protein [Planctomycetota bacterium]
MLKKEYGKLNRRLPEGNLLVRPSSPSSHKNNSNGQLTKFAVFALLCCISLSSGCQLGYFLTDPDATKKVPADYNKIGGRRVAVVVWADRSTLDEYANARRQVARSIIHYMRKNLEKAQFVPETKVNALQTRSGLDWEAMSNGEIAKELGCDMILRIDLLDFTTRASDTPQLRKARIAGNIRMYESRPVENLDAVYDGDIKITYPPGSIHGTQDEDEADLLHAAVEYFAEMAARKFYDHEVKLKGPPSE